MSIHPADVRMIDTTRGPFDVIYSDVPIDYNSRPQSGSRFGGGADEQYFDHDGDGRSTMSHEELADLPVSPITAENAYLFYWSTWPTIHQDDGRHRLVTIADIQRWRHEAVTRDRYLQLLDIIERFLLAQSAFDVIRRWGFTYRTLGFLYVKTYANGEPRMGQGFYTKANSEPCLLAVKGKPWKLTDKISQIISGEQPPVEIWAPVTRHSEKPAIIRDKIEEFCGPNSRRVELFARTTTPGWRAAGNEIDGLDMRDALRSMREEIEDARPVRQLSLLEAAP